MPAPGFDAFVGLKSTPFYRTPNDRAIAGELLWGDGVRFQGERRNGRIKVSARGRNRVGWIDEAAIENGRSLLEIYFIDVGQGDGLLVKTPDFRHIMIDGGHPRRSQNTGKSAADFIDWKFFEDYGLDEVHLDAMIASHNDFDHYGGLSDLLDAAQFTELDAVSVAIDAFFHAGISWWTKPDGTGRTLGATKRKAGRSYHTQLLEDRASAERGLAAGAGARLQGEWARFIAQVVAARTAQGTAVPMARLSQTSGFLPGFEPADGHPAVSVLGPIEYDIDGKPGLQGFGADSKTTNGNSVLLRIDYGRARILLTGDLNKASQQALLEAYAGRRLEFQCDVAKACHHGSEDVSYAFLQSMAAAATIISSGDGEGHDHPKPRIVAASGATGHLSIDNDEILTPLVYSTELARSVSLGDPTGLDVAAGGAQASISLGANDLQRATIAFSETKPGALRPVTKTRALSRTKVVAGLIYGLVNVRTDGETILSATMNEGDGTWAVKTFASRF